MLSSSFNLWLNFFIICYQFYCSIFSLYCRNRFFYLLHLKTLIKRIHSSKFFHSSCLDCNVLSLFYLIAQLFYRPYALYAAVVEFYTLTDPYRTRTDDKDLFLVASYALVLFVIA